MAAPADRAMTSAGVTIRFAKVLKRFIFDFLMLLLQLQSKNATALSIVRTPQVFVVFHQVALILLGLALVPRLMLSST
ncbi:hypothetical protein AB838_07865 [Rhodobacteraceae bacterium (ex Bugula neritina AB1)]|nr:hypothetical protein AB838_07865 [Rhodobacteraceae bacterium (ex Bugula neritina AB1)]